MGKKWIYLLVLLTFFAYAAWMIGPYLRSVILRDASVTTWSRAAVAPIEGRVATQLPQVGDLVGANGHVATLKNDLLLQEARAVEDTRDRLVLSQSRIAEAREYLADLDELERQRLVVKKRNAEVFHAQLETEIANLRREIAVSAKRIKVSKRIASRQQKLVKRGTGSGAKLDEALLRVAGMNLRHTELQAALKFALLRDRSAEDEVYITRDGDTPDWLRYSELELQLERRRTRHELHAAESAHKEASRDLAIELKTLAELGQAIVNAPPGSVVFSVVVAPEATVSAGDRIIEWIDCSALMIDVPVSDAELPLILRGARAEVVLEGEPNVREATVLMTRGSSATLGRADLAAIAKGRVRGVAQVLLTLSANAPEFDRCPVGRAAYVEFPDVGLIDILRARLRL